MAVLEEWAVVAICVGVGVWTAKSVGSVLKEEREPEERGPEERNVKNEGFLPPVAPVVV